MNVGGKQINLMQKNTKGLKQGCGLSYGHTNTSNCTTFTSFHGGSDYFCTRKTRTGINDKIKVQIMGTKDKDGIPV